MEVPVVLGAPAAKATSEDVTVLKGTVDHAATAAANRCAGKN
jgi:hypothetical protein